MVTTARMTNPAFAVPSAMDALNALSKSVSQARVPISLELVHLRASQINGCSVCVDMHAKAARKAGESEERVFAVSAWRETPYFSDGERAALTLTEALTASSPGNRRFREPRARAPKGSGCRRSRAPRERARRSRRPRP